MEKQFARFFLQQLSQYPLCNDKGTATLPLHQPPIQLPVRQPGTIQVTVRALRGGNTVTVTMTTRDTLASVKEQVAKSMDMPVTSIRLLRNGKVLPDRTHVMEYAVEGTLTLQMVIMGQKNSFQNEPVQDIRISSEKINQTILLDTAFWKDLRDFLDQRLGHTSIQVYEAFKRAFNQMPETEETGLC